MLWWCWCVVSCALVACAFGRGLNSSRKVLKADREKLRRDKLNEQFLELAGVLGEPSLWSPQTHLAPLIWRLLDLSTHSLLLDPAFCFQSLSYSMGSPHAKHACAP